MPWQEVFGIIGTSFIIVSFLINNIKWIRILSVFGEIFFVVYGLLINAWSTWIMNIFLIVIQIVYLTKYYKESKKQKQSNDEAN